MTGRAHEPAWSEIAAIMTAAAAAPAYAAQADELRAARDWDSFRALPCSTKEAFRTDFRDFLTGAPPVRLHSTSGSTGKPAFVVYSAEEIESITVGGRKVVRTLRRKEKIVNNDLPEIAERYRAFRKKNAEPGT